MLSRKGFDSSVGGYPSPVLPDGRLVSLPVPSSFDALGYDDIRFDRRASYADLMRTLRVDRKIGSRGAHLDPDLNRAARPRKRGWRPSLGQIGAAAGHLRNQGVGSGDLFLFYGWFRHTAMHAGELRFVGDPGGFHCIFGYLWIGEVMAVREDTALPAWLADHPHAIASRRRRASNTLYVADAVRGAGTFHYREALRLTKPGDSRSRWALEREVFEHLGISYHTQAAWRNEYFQSYPRAQEYVIHADDGAAQWAKALIAGSGSDKS